MENKVGTDYSLLTNLNVHDLINKIEIEVEKVSGYCSCGYKVGDKFYAEGLNTPNREICGGAYMVIFPLQTALHCGASFDFGIEFNLSKKFIIDLGAKYSEIKVKPIDEEVDLSGFQVGISFLVVI